MEPFLLVRVGEHFKFKKQPQIYRKTSPETYTKAEVKPLTEPEQFIDGITSLVIPTEYKEHKGCVNRKNIIWKNVQPFILIRWETRFKWLFSDTVYTKTGFNKYTGNLKMRSGQLKLVEFTFINPINTLMEVIYD